MKILFIIGLTILVACSKSTDVNDACLDKILKEHNMVPYRGEEWYCTSLIKWECGNINYYGGSSCIGDILFDPFDCDGNYVARLNGERDGEYYPANLEKYGFGTEKCKYVGVVGIWKK